MSRHRLRDPRPTRQAALRAGTGSEAGVDLAAAMVDEAAAAAAAEGVANARFEVGHVERGTGVVG